MKETAVVYVFVRHPVQGVAEADTKGAAGRDLSGDDRVWTGTDTAMAENEQPDILRKI